MADRQNLAFDYREPPDPSQNITGTFRVFYDIGAIPNTFMRPAGLCCGQRRRAILFDGLRRNQRLALGEAQALHRDLGSVEKSEGELPAVAVRRIVHATQRHVLTGQHGCKRRLVDPIGLDTRKADLAPVIQPKAAAIDDAGNASLADRLEQAG